MSLTTRLVSTKAELAVLRGMCNKEKKIAGLLLSSVDDSYFHFKESVEVYESIKRHMRETGESPSYRLALEDPDLSEEAKQHFKNSAASIQTSADAKKASRILNMFRQRRGLFNIAAHINDSFQRSKFDLDDLLESTATGLNIVRSKKSTQDSFLHLGTNNNSLELVKSILYDDRKDDIIPTGVKAFDDVAGGLARGSLFTVSSTSGGGKSTLTMAIGMKMARMGYKVLMVPLEMSRYEMMCRMMANTTKTNLTKIMTQKLTDAEKEKVFKRHRLWERKVKEAGGRFTIFKPEEDMTIEEIMAATSAYTCDIKIIDYISLLKGVDGDDMWRQLGAVARYCKINAETDHCVNILVCQLNDEGKVRYSRAITEHSSNSWTWVATKEAKETGIMRIEQPKSRNSESYPFSIKIDYEHMRIEDIDQNYDSGLGAVEDRTDDTDGKSNKATKSKRGITVTSERASAAKRKRKDDIPNLAADI